MALADRLGVLAAFLDLYHPDHARVKRFIFQRYLLLSEFYERLDRARAKQ